MTLSTFSVTWFLELPRSHRNECVASFSSMLFSLFPVFEDFAAGVEEAKVGQSCIARAVSNIDTELVQVFCSIDIESDLLRLVATNDWERNVFAFRQDGFLVCREEDVALSCPSGPEVEDKAVRACW